MGDTDKKPTDKTQADENPTDKNSYQQKRHMTKTPHDKKPTNKPPNYQIQTKTVHSPFSISVLFFIQQVSMLNKFSEMIRGNLTKLQRLKIVALVTIEVHARDVIEKLIKSGCSDVNAFEWLSQLRLYWERVSIIITRATCGSTEKPCLGPWSPSQLKLNEELIKPICFKTSV